MTEQVHFIPVGFDFHRLIYPISKGKLAADRVILFDTDTEDADSLAGDLAGNMVRRLSEAFELVDVTVEEEQIALEELYSYEELYPEAYEYLWTELEAGNEVFVNISSMPRTVAFAFATAANSIITERSKEIRDQVHTYYVAPENYLVIDMIEVIDNQIDFLEKLEDIRVPERLHELREVKDKIDRFGVTAGVRELDDGSMFVEFPASPSREIQPFEQYILKFLFQKGAMDSTSQLAEQLAEYLGEEFNDSFRSRVQYNVSNLDDQGYVDRQEAGNRHETSLSTMGMMWVKTHPE